MIAFDLPGHGASDQAKNPEQTYTYSGYATVIAEALQKIGVNNYVAAGSSLGGAVALSMLAQNAEGLKGLFVNGMPPVNPGEMLPGVGYKAMSKSSEDSFNAFVEKEYGVEGGFLGLIRYGNDLKDEGEKGRKIAEFFITGQRIVPQEFMLQGVLNTHGLARSIMMQNVQDGKFPALRDAVESTKIPVTFANDPEDFAVRMEFLEEVEKKNSQVESVSFYRAGHGAYWCAHEAFNMALEDAWQRSKDALKAKYTSSPSHPRVAKTPEDAGMSL